jgi:tetratricopeptide (TPR) repeat protein
MATTSELDFTRADLLHMDAAEGWLGLGNHLEANAELENIPASLRGTAQVLLLRWGIYCAARSWLLAAEVARAITKVKPDDRRGWLHYSFALHEMKRTAEARDNLLDVIDHFPKCALMRYNLACYECQLGNLEQARAHLKKAFALKGGAELRASSTDDPDLTPLWSEISKI